MALEVGEAYVTLVPSARGFGSAMSLAIRDDVRRAGRAASTDFATSMAAGLQPAMRTMSTLMSRSMRGVGADMARDVSREMRTVLAGSASPNARIDVNINAAQVTAEFRVLLSSLEALSRANPVNIHVSVSATAAAAQMTAAVAAAQASTAAASMATGSAAGTAFGGAWATAAAAAIAGGAALVVAGMGYVGIKTAAQMEQAGIAFETMLGSGEKAKSFLDELKKFAAETPFEFPELQTAASSLISAGFAARDVIPIMKTLGNTTSGMGTGSEGVKRATVALQQMAAAGRITGEDLNQLRDAGVPVFDLLASATGKTKEEVSALAQAGKLGKTEMNQLFEALKTGNGLERFNGLMEKQAQSLAGLWSTLKDNFQMGLADAIEPLIPYLKQAMDRMAPVIKDGMESMSASFVSAIDAGRDMAAFLRENEAPIKLVGSAIAGAAVGFTAYKVAVTLATVATKLWAAALAVTPLGWVALAIGAVVGALVYLYRNVEPVRKVMDQLWASIKSGAASLWQAVQPGFQAIGSFITDTLAPALQRFWSEVVQPVFAAIGSLVMSVWEGVLKPVLSALWDVLQNVIAPVVLSLWQNIIQPVFAAIGSHILWVWTNVLQPAFAALNDYITNVLGPILTWLWVNVVQPVFQWIGDKIAETWNGFIYPTLLALSTYVSETLIPVVADLWPIVRSVWDQVGDKINKTWIFIRGIFELLKGGLNSVRDYFDRITGEIRILWDQMKANVAKPINFVINEVLNKGLIAGWNLVADGIGQKDKKWAPLTPIAGYDRGGWTGPGGKYDPAGIVHADEFVIRKESQRDISREAPGLLDALNRYGAAALGRLAPGFSDGGLVPGYAGGGLAKPWPTYVAALVKKMFGVRDIGGYGQRANASDHPSGNALDIMVPVRSELGDRIAAWGLANFNPLMLKYIIWKQAISKGGGWKGMADRGGTTANHYDHNHWSFIHDTWGRPAELGPVLSPDEVASLVASGGAGNPMEAILMSAIRPILDGAKLAAGSIPVTYGDSPWTRMASGFGLNRIDAVEKFIAEKISSMFGVVGSYGPGDSEPGAVGGVKGVVQSVASQYGWGGGAQWAALDWLIQHESSWNPNAKNPSSTAYGLFQFLNSTWAGTGIGKTSDPRQQAAAGMKYISQRYGTPTSAKAFWEKNHWYADGGLVKPRLYDTGGILPPGLTLAMNATGKPETIRTFEQERTIQQQLAGGGGATYVTNVHGGGDPQRAAAEVEQVMRRNEIRRRARERVLAHA